MEKSKIKILTLKEEKQLSNSELQEYYEKLREYAKTRKLTNTTPGATSIAPKLKEATNKIADKLTDFLAGGNVIKVSDGQENIPEGPVIYAHSHQGLLDNFSWIPFTPEHAVILHSKKVKKILVFVQLNTGLVLVSKDPSDKENRQNAKLDLMTLGLNGISLAYFPEAAWNLSPNKLHLPMNYGFLDIARKTGMPVIPTVDEFSYDTSGETVKITKIHTRFGKPIYVNIKDDLSKKLLEHEEQISTMRWELIEEKGLYHRKEISNMDYIKYLQKNIQDLKMGEIDINVERETIWQSEDEFYKFFHINDVPYNEVLAKYGYAQLLETEEVRKLKRINKIHNI